MKYLYGSSRPADLKAMSEDNADLFFRCHSAIWSVDHLRPSEALNELCKILFAKTYDERTSPGGRFRAVPGDPKTTSRTIKSLYRDAVQDGLNEIEVPGSKGILDEPLQLSDAAIFRVVELLQSYALVGAGVDVKGAAFQQLTEAAVRSGMGQYFTPEPVVTFMVEVSQVSSSDVVLDPFCGSGHFLAACADAVERSSEATGAAKREFGTSNLLGIEKDEHMVRVALTDALLHGNTRIRVLNRDALLPLSSYKDAFGPGVGSGTGVASLVLTNPPFGKRVPIEAMASLGNFELAFKEHPTPLEVLGLERAISFLKPGGRLAIVLPHSVLTNRSMQKVREYVAKVCRVHAVISLPPEAFARHAGVGQASVLYLERKKEVDPELKEEYSVYCAACGCVGYDQTGRPHGRNELPDIASEFIHKFSSGNHPLAIGFTVDIRELLRRGFGPEQHLRALVAPNEASHPLGELCSRIFTGISPGRGGFAETGVRVLKVGDLTGEGIDWKPSGDRAWVGVAFAERHADKRLEPGDILLTAAAHQRRYIGMKVDIVDQIRSSNPVSFCSGEVMVLRPRRSLVDPFYLLGWLRSKEGYAAIQTCVRGQTAHLYPDDMREVIVPLPGNGSSGTLARAAKLYSSAQELRNRAKELTEEANHAILGLLGEAPRVARGPGSRERSKARNRQRELTSW